jgi:hypothetical protein
MQDAVVELLEIGIPSQRRVASLAEHKAQEPIVLLGDAPQMVFPCRGRDRWREPDIAHDVLARRKASDRPQDQERGQRRERAHAWVRHEPPSVGVGVSDLGDLALEDGDSGIQPGQELAMDSGRAPQGIRGGHFSDEGDDLGVDGRPPGGFPESVAQCSRKRRRCQRTTVSGVTMTSGRRHPTQTLASQTQKRRSLLRSLGRATVRLYTAS